MHGVRTLTRSNSMTKTTRIFFISFLSILCVSFFVPGDSGFGRSLPMAIWEGDGGVDADYSNIPRLRWTGPGSPGTYGEYLGGRETMPFSTAPLYVTPSKRGDELTVKALVLVNSSLYSGIESNLTRYVSDLEFTGYAVEVHLVSGGTPEDLKTFIITNSTDLAGCVYVGDLPVAWYECEVWGHEEFPCDLYYMDLDGTWSDGDSDGIFDYHSAGSGDEGPEIFIGHIDASMMSGDEESITNEYLDKNHNYRSGGMVTPEYALSYTEDDWAAYMDIRTDIQYAYPDFDDIPAPATNRDDYVDNRVPNTAYEFVQMCCHSSSSAHYFTRGGLAYNYQIQAVQPHAMFFNLFACSSLRYTDSNFLGGSYIYDTSTTSLSVIGSTKTGSMLVFWAFYQPFGAGECFGEAFRQWFNYLAPYNDDEIGWHYGMTITGDPFLGKVEPALYLNFPGEFPSGQMPPGPETPITVEIQSGSGSYEPGTGFLYYRFDPSDAYTAVPFAPQGGDLYEVVIPGARPGDSPEFYFVAETGTGVVVTAPPDAPENVYSYDVCLAQALFTDDFEEETGWSVENIDLAAGAWERCLPHAASGGQVVPLEDNPAVAGSFCFVTENGPPGGYYRDYDGDGGPTMLISPRFSIGGGDAVVDFYTWFQNDDGDDPFFVDVSNDDGSTWTNVSTTYSSPAEWIPMSFTVSDYLEPTDQLRVRFGTADNPSNSITEAGLDDFRVQSVDTDTSIWAEAYQFSASVGCNIDFFLDAGADNADRPYLMGGCSSGPYPGTTLPGGEVIPLNRDALTDIILNNLNGVVFQNFSGTLDESGRATATLNLPSPINPDHAGKTITFAFTLTDGFDFVSNPVLVKIDP